MKTKKCHRKTILLWSVLFFLQSFFLSSQLLETMDWKTFVEGSSNYLVCDTFFRQTFEGRPSDRWKYITTGNTSLFDASMVGITGQEGNTSLKLPIGSSVRFDNPFALYNTTLTVKFAGCNLRVNDGLRLSISRGGVPKSVIWALSKKDGIKINYGDKTDGEPGQTNMANPMQLSDSPQYIHLESVASQAADDNSFFCIDEVYGYGDIPCYSLFSGDGQWGELDCWSHLPPSSQRKALLEGTCRLTHVVDCKELHVKGELLLEKGGVCKVENCYLYDKGTFNFQGGTIVVENKMCVSLELPEKDAWYFFSLPFDVYPEGLDPDMQWGRGAAGENGNFFYLMQYDSESRATNGLSSSNWQQLLAENYSSDQPLLEKGKGYLIALDQQSDRKHLTFTSREGERISYSGKDFIRLEELKESVAGHAHQGWHLCGNPFPASLMLEHIAVNEMLDGYVYLYVEDEYQAYPLTGKYIIPPYAAFFVKASADTELDIQIKGNSSPDYTLPPFLPYGMSGKEPEDKYILENEERGETAEITFKRRGRTLFFENITSPARLYIADISGTIVFRCEVSEAPISLPLHIQPGIYIACIYTNRLRNQYKFILDE